MDLCPRHSERQPQAHQAPVSLTAPCRISLPRPDLAVIRNTQERKPVTNSRDTQELLPEAGQEMLRIFHTHPARTSLLQDFAFYEVSYANTIRGNTLIPLARSYKRSRRLKRKYNQELHLRTNQEVQSRLRFLVPPRQHNTPSRCLTQLPSRTPLKWEWRQ